MAKITIELDTDANDTLEKALAMMEVAGWSPVPKDGWGAETDDKASERNVALGDKATDPNAWKPEVTVKSTGEGVTVETAPEAKFISEPMTDEDGAKIIGGATPILGDMDGDRKRGEPGPGRKRRTAEQVESDRLWMQQKERGHAALAKMDEGVHDHDEPQTVAEQDALADLNAEASAGLDEEDEAAETAQRADGEPTLDDLRAAIMRYNAKHGYVASIEKMREIIGCAPSDVPKDQIANAIAKVDLATTGKVQVMSPPMKTPETEPETLSLFADEPKTATKEQFNEAIKAYAKKYDGTDDFSEYGARVPTMLGDVKSLFTREFGVGVVNLKTLPGGETPEALGRIVAAIKLATDENPFGRKAK